MLHALIAAVCIAVVALGVPSSGLDQLTPEKVTKVESDQDLALYEVLPIADRLVLQWARVAVLSEPEIPWCFEEPFVGGGRDPPLVAAPRLDDLQWRTLYLKRRLSHDALPRGKLIRVA